MPARARGLIVGVLLAPGAGSRFGGDKLVARLADGRGRARPGALEDELRAAGAQVVRCAAEDFGMSASIARGVAASADAAGWLVALGDMPLVPTTQHRLIADALRAGAGIAAPVCQGRRGHPVAFAARFGDELRALAGDEGARALLVRHRDALVKLPVACDTGWQDVDTPSDLAAVNRRLLGD